MTFVTYDPTKGVRALPNSQFAALSNGIVTQNNVRVTGTVNVTSPTTVNSLRLDTNGLITGAGTVTVTSGAVLTAADPVPSIGGRELGNLRFLGEGVITTYDNRTINSITGTADGLVFNGGGLRIVNTPLAVPGPLTINAGTLYVTSFGAGSELGTVTDIRLNGGGLGYTGSGAATTSRGFALGAGGGSLSGADSLTVSGQLTDLPGQAGVLVAGNLILTGANTYTGGTIITGFLQVSSDANLGAGSAAVTLAPGSVPTESVVGLLVDGTFATNRSLIIGASTLPSAMRFVDVSAGNRFTLNGRIESPTASRTQAFTLTKSGQGTMVVGNTDNPMNGQFAVSAGTLLVNGSLGPVNFVETATTNGLIVSSAAAVGGTGVIGRGVRVASGATLTPGDPLSGSGAGTLTTERLTLNDGATWLVDLRSAVARPGSSPADVTPTTGWLSGDR